MSFFYVEIVIMYLCLARCARQPGGVTDAWSHLHEQTAKDMLGSWAFLLFVCVCRDHGSEF